MLNNLRVELAELHQMLPANGLVAWTSGNISARDPETGFIAIKASGIRYEDIDEATIVIVDENGAVQYGDLKPSSDVLTHCYIYRHRRDTHGIVHTHSRYATAFAIHGESIPCATTAIADEFGGAIPCGGFAPIGDEAIGRVVVDTLADSRSPACLLKSHGVFAIGRDATQAVKAAVMTEDNAAIVWAARQLGVVSPLRDTVVSQLHRRYTKDYGQDTV